MNPRHHHPQAPLTAEEQQAAATLVPFVEATRRNLDKALDDVALRKWVVEEAAQYFPHYVIKGDDRIGDLAALLAQIYAWVRKPVDDALTQLEDKAKGR